MKKISVSESESKTEAFIKEFNRHKQRKIAIKNDEGSVIGQGTFVQWDNLHDPHRDHDEAAVHIDGQGLVMKGEGVSIFEPSYIVVSEDKIVFLDGKEPPPAFYVTEDNQWRFSARLPSYYGYVTSQTVGILPDEAELIFNLFKDQKKTSHLISGIIRSYKRRLSDKVE